MRYQSKSFYLLRTPDDKHHIVDDIIEPVVGFLWREAMGRAELSQIIVEGGALSGCVANLRQSLQRIVGPAVQEHLRQQSRGVELHRGLGIGDQLQKFGWPSFISAISCRSSTGFFVLRQVAGALSELFERLAADTNLLTCCRRRAFRRVCSVVNGLSDEHQYGRTVAKVTFACGLSLVYRPRDMGYFSSERHVESAPGIRAPETAHTFRPS